MGNKQPIMSIGVANSGSVADIIYIYDPEVNERAIISRTQHFINGSDVIVSVVIDKKEIEKLLKLKS